MEDVSLIVAKGSSTSSDLEGHVQRREEANERSPLVVNGDKDPTVVFSDRNTVSKREKLKKLFSVCSLWVAYTVISAAYSIIGPFFPNEALAKGATPVITGIIMSSSPFCVVILSPVFGYFLTKLGSRFMIFSGTFLVGGAYVLLGFTSMLSSGWMFIVFCVILRMLEGVGSALFMTSAFTLLPLLYPDSVGRITGIFEVGGGIGFAVGPPIGGYLYQLGGFRLPFIVIGGLVLIFLIPLFFAVKELAVPKQSSPLRLMLRLCTNVPFLVLVIMNILSIAALGFFNPVLQPFLTDEYNLTPLIIGVVFFIGPVIYMVFSLPLGYVSDRMNPRYLIIPGIITYVFGFFFLGPPEFISAPKLWINCVAYGIIGLATALTLIPAYPDMLNISEQYLRNSNDKVMMTAVVSGIVSSTLSFGEFLGPLVGGALTEVFSFPMSSVLLAEVFAAEACLLLGVTLIDRYT